MSGISHLGYVVKYFCCSVGEAREVRTQVTSTLVLCVIDAEKNCFMSALVLRERERTVAVGPVLWFFCRGRRVSVRWDKLLVERWRVLLR